GGTTSNATYRNMGDHSETLQIDYDPVELSFEEIVKYFWTSHNSSRNGYGGRQYMSILLYHDERHREVMMQCKRDLENKTKMKIETEIAP
ncbi:peptide-methionine (S)-S-oxide reductase, partial [Pseudomonas sp. 2822-17]|uniref:peptide-methionine (S)-S-oxide reductase n=1 Tax=Pseudomonas sp. 2822-17 TaxID=1712678 RepID=UPI00117BC5D0